ncbi:DUF1380 domain-containing protein, partial [Escherichia coli]|nr:DUF1380 domain-containing protein [Escherichia coli]
SVAMEIINNVRENRQVTVPECVTRRQAVVNQARILLKNNTHEND